MMKTMSALELATAYDKEVSGGDLQKAAELLADDFMFVGVTPEPLDKTAAMALFTNIRTGLPDFKQNLRDMSESGDVVTGTAEVTGTHTGTLTLPDGTVLPPTGKKWHNPAEKFTVTVHDGKIVEMVVEQVSGGGVAGLVAQLT